MKVAIVGTQGVPAGYGGFESLAENLLRNSPEDIEYTVFCSSRDLPTKPGRYLGAKLEYIPLHANGIQSIPYDILSMVKSLRGYECILVLGISGCIFLPILKAITSKKVVVNIDGLEYKRSKWGRIARSFLRLSERIAVRRADRVISDNRCIQRYVRERYGVDAEYIAYGGDHAGRSVSQEFIDKVLSDYGLTAGEYAMSLCRIEPENNCEMILEAFARTGKELIFIGSWDNSDRAADLRKRYSGYQNIKMPNEIYDLDILYALRRSARVYLHGHSAGGTNPSLVEAMFFGMPIIAYDVEYNRATTENAAYYFESSEDIERLLSQSLSGEPMQEIANRSYLWKDISGAYCGLFRKICYFCNERQEA